MKYFRIEKGMFTYSTKFIDISLFERDGDIYSNITCKQKFDMLAFSLNSLLRNRYDVYNKICGGETVTIYVYDTKSGWTVEIYIEGKDIASLTIGKKFEYSIITSHCECREEEDIVERIAENWRYFVF